MEKSVFKHGNTGKRNAAREHPKGAKAVCRCGLGEKGRWVQAARRAGMSLSAWLRDLANREAGEEQGAPASRRD